MTRKTINFFDDDVNYILKLKKARIINTETDVYRPAIQEYVKTLKEKYGENPKKKKYQDK